MKIQPASAAFTVVLGFLAAVPYSGIDINLPALAATGAALGTSPSHVGLTMSVYMLGLAIAPLLYGPISDRVGRKPVVVFGLVLFVFASLACAAAQSLPMLLICRAVQGVGAAGTTTIFAVIRDLFDEASGRAKIGSVMIAINVVTVIAPTAGAALLAIGGWRLIYAAQAVAGLILIPTVLYGLAESAKFDAANRIAAFTVLKDYLRIVTHPVSMAFILIGAAAGSAVFAYVTGSSLYFIKVAGLQPQQYGMIFSACSAAVMFGAFLDGQLGRRGVPPADVLTVGLVLLFVASSTMLVTTLAGLSPPALVTSLLMLVALAFGLSMPNLMNATMQPLPDIAGAVSAAAGSIQLGSGAIASGLVALLFDGRSALSMAAVMAATTLLALILYLRFTRSAGRPLAT
ncbi:MFS transporter [Bradyrhizobium liaoningense]|uniref:MFS transporter n=1 Tax=Bradyrhizobium liaoningense TaxID=43992 RepID=UPI001BA93EA1|nr:MFS transporter [Bradyrhizobium liaoningense]MBR0906155.1 MFS transporter [Bradyrhizobium liaoningense]